MKFRLTDSAQADIHGIVAWSAERFGEAASERYLALILAAIYDVAAKPEHIGSRRRPELGVDVRTWHLRLSRHHAAGQAVQRPRHFLLYRVSDDLVVIRRVLHEAMDLPRHVDPDD